MNYDDWKLASPPELPDTCPECDGKRISSVKGWDAKRQEYKPTREATYSCGLRLERKRDGFKPRGSTLSCPVYMTRIHERMRIVDLLLPLTRTCCGTPGYCAQVSECGHCRLAEDLLVELNDIAKHSGHATFTSFGHQDVKEST